MPYATTARIPNTMPVDDTLLIAFYRDGARDTQGRTHSEILAWSDELLEAVHDYIQWLFPLPEISGANPSAPLLTPRVLEAFTQSAEMRARLRAAFLRMARFYGFATQPDGSLLPTPGLFPVRTRIWLTPHNHNHLRITRILRSLHLAGLAEESAAFFRAVAGVYQDEQRTGRGRISENTFAYWQRATL